MKRRDDTESPEDERQKAGKRAREAAATKIALSNITEFPGLGKTFRFVVGRRRSAVARSLRKVFYRPGSIPLAGDHFCHG